MHRSPDTPRLARLTPDPPPNPTSNDDRLTADPFPVRSTRRTHPDDSRARTRTPGHPPRPTAQCFSCPDSEMPPAAPTASTRSGGGGISSAETLSARAEVRP